MKILKNQVAAILEHDPSTRSDDNALVVKVWRTFYPQYLSFDTMWVSLDKIRDLPSYDNVTRYRRMLAPLYPPTPEVNAHRHRLQKEKRKEFGESLEDQLVNTITNL